MLILMLRTKVPGNESSQKRKFQGTKVPGDECSKEQKFQGQKIPSMKLSFPGMKILEYKSSSYLFILHLHQSTITRLPYHARGFNVRKYSEKNKDHIKAKMQQRRAYSP